MWGLLMFQETSGFPPSSPKVVISLCVTMDEIGLEH